MAGIPPAESLEGRTVSVEALYEQVKCPGCLGIGKIPFRLCERGHLVCGDCVKKLAECPLCQAEFSLESPACVKNIIESLPRPCQYAGLGCTKIIEPADSEHRFFCGFRNVDCKQCEVELPVGQLREHFIKEHPRNIFQCPNGSTTLKARQGSLDFYYLLFSAYDTLFWLVLKRDSNKEAINITFEGVLIGNPTEDYFITVKIEKYRVGPSVTRLKASEKNINTSEEGGLSSTSVLFSSIKHCIDMENILVMNYDLFSIAKLT